MDIFKFIRKIKNYAFMKLNKINICLVAAYWSKKEIFKINN